VRIRPGFYLRLSVIDDGTGMDADTLAHAIEPFYSTKELGRGTGLGLSMVHGLAAQLGGGFHLISEPGEGTRVDLYLPPANEAPAGHVPAKADPARIKGRPLKVLLIDDEDLVRAAIGDMIRDLGHEVVEASGASEGLALLAEGLEVNVVVTDYLMPGINGGVVARQVAELNPGVRVLLITGYTGAAEDVVDLPRLSKPFGQRELASALASLFADDEKVVRLRSR
jgi:CheY-like chemotaxis protein